MILGLLFGSIIGGALGDKFGRKKIFVVARLIEIGFFALFLVATDYYIMLVAITGLGFCGAGRVGVGVVYLSEMFPMNKQTLV